MGYEVHITRRRDWADAPAKGDITHAEFKALVEGDPQLEFRDASFSLHADQTHEQLAFLMGNEESAFQTYVRPDEAGQVPALWNWLAFHKGNLTSKYPSPNMIRKMICLAEQLNAMVQDDHGEIFFLNERGELDTREPDYEEELEG